MKKLMYFIAAGAFLASCNRDISQVEDPGAEARISIKDASELRAQLLPMSESFTVTSKAAHMMMFTYKNFAEAPTSLAYTEELPTGIVTGTSHLAQATSVTASGDMVFVTWHLEDARYGGSISAYKLQHGSGTYHYTSRIDFEDTDWHEAEAIRNTNTGNYEIFAVGQRSPSTSGYLLNGHRGAVVGKVLYDYIADEFQGAGSYKELPLPGFGANSIVTSAGKYYIVTGNGTGVNTTEARSGLYVTDYNLTNVAEAMTITDGIFVAADEFSSTPSSVDYALLDRTGTNKAQIRRGMNTTQTVSNSMAFTFDYLNRTGISSLERERGGMDFTPFTYSGNNVTSTEYILALGQAGVYSQNLGYKSDALTTCNAVTSDAAARVIYASAGAQGMLIMAGHGFNGGALINPFDAVAWFVPPTNSYINGFNVKDVSVYFSDYLAIAVGGTNAAGNSSERGGVYFVRKSD